MTISNVLTGIPSASLLPLAKYKFRELTALNELVVPIKGVFPPESPFSGAFDIMPNEGVILFGVLNQVLLAFSKYPNLADNQLFVISGLELSQEHIIVVGKIFEFVEDQ